jgi:hypothetical protein
MATASPFFSQGFDEFGFGHTLLLREVQDFITVFAVLSKKIKGVALHTR